jgi:hypothetical protein
VAQHDTEDVRAAAVTVCHDGRSRIRDGEKATPGLLAGGERSDARCSNCRRSRGPPFGSWWMRCADRPRSSLPWIVARHGSQSLSRPAALGFTVAGAAESPAPEPSAPGGRIGWFCLDGVLVAGANAARSMPSSRATRRCDQPRCRRDRIVSIMATWSRLDMVRLVRYGRYTQG